MNGGYVSRGELKDVLIQSSRKMGQAGTAARDDDSYLSTFLKAFIGLLITLNAPKWVPAGVLDSKFAILLLFILCALKY